MSEHSTTQPGLRVLLIAPQPFYSERGTPIAVRLLAEALCDDGHSVHLLAYHVGVDISYTNLKLFRSPALPWIRDVPIGISMQKIVCDVALCFRLLQLLWTGKYDVIHAVEESIFPALVLNVFSKRRLIYDMDSLLSEQLVDKWRWFRPFSRALIGIERAAIRRCDRVLAVCEDLADKVRGYVPAEKVMVLPDVPMPSVPGGAAVDRLSDHLPNGEMLLLYVGNLEHYQGVDLLLTALALVKTQQPFKLIVIGGLAQHIEEHRKLADDLHVGDKVLFLGTRPVGALSQYLEQADVLISPRTLGQNTPMKVYSYMQAGKAILATRIRSHTQVLDDQCAMLADPTPAALAQSLSTLVSDAELRARLGAAALNSVETRFSLAMFKRKLRHVYAGLAVATS